MSKEKLSFEAPVVDDVDVLVCGGGPAGIAAAVSAVRQGASVLLIEKQGCLGGVATNCLVGVFSQIVDRLAAAMTAQSNMAFTDIDVTCFQRNLAKAGAILPGKTKRSNS